MSLPLLDRWSSLLRALAAQAAALVLLLVVAALLPAHLHLAVWIWLLLQGALAVFFSHCLGLGSVWLGFQALLPFALVWQAGHRVSPWVYPFLLLGFLLLFGGGLRSRVPLYHSNRPAWRALVELVPEQGAVADLGSGLGGPLVFLARSRPEVRCLGVEASPLVWFLAWLRAFPVREHCEMRLGSFWNLPLEKFQVVYAFLSPVPMPALWEKALREMAPGSLLVSNTFEVPGVTAERVIPLPGRRDACLRIYRIP